MSVRSFEAQILREARISLNNKKLRQKDIAEWSTGNIEMREGETVLNLAEAGVYIAVADEHDKRKRTPDYAGMLARSLRGEKP